MDEQSDGQMTPSQAAKLLSQLGCSKGGKARALTLTARRRSEIARAGGRAYAAVPAEIRSQNARKGWRTRRARQLGKADQPAEYDNM